MTQITINVETWFSVLMSIMFCFITVLEFINISYNYRLFKLKKESNKWKQEIAKSAAVMSQSLEK